MFTQNRKGFTLIELAICIAIGFILIFMVFLPLIIGGPIVARGNCWYNRDALVRELRVNHPAVSELLTTETHIIDPSIVVVENKDKSRDTYLLDSDILFNYKFTRVDKKVPQPEATNK